MSERTNDVGGEALGLAQQGLSFCCAAHPAKPPCCRVDRGLVQARQATCQPHSSSGPWGGQVGSGAEVRPPPAPGRAQYRVPSTLGRLGA